MNVGMWLDLVRASAGGARALRNRRRRRARQLVRYARQRSPFYRQHYAEIASGERSFRRLPPVTKNELMEAFDQWVTDPRITRAGIEAFVRDPGRIGERYLDRYLVWTTSGVTGTPALLVQDDRSLEVYTALAVIRGWLRWLEPSDIARLLRRGLRVATIAATGGHYGAAVEVVRSQREHRRFARHNQIFSVTSPPDELVASLNRYQPSVLIGYPTALAILAAQQRAGRLSIAPVLMGCVGERLTPAARHEIWSGFGCTVRDSYGSSEAGAIAFECRRGWLHVNSDWVVLEPIDVDGRPCLPGTISHSVLVTNLANFVQPIIRYDLGDSITLRPTACECGSSLPAIRAQGRTNDILSLRTSTGQVVRLAPLAVATVVEETPGVDRFQVVQVDPCILQVRLVPSTGSDRGEVWKRVSSALERFLGSQGLDAVQLMLAAEAPSHDRSGKFRQVLRLDSQ
jgi:phenylacetate-coenzyme A ligase PaaK-like adenylate-forming protein